MPGTLLFLHGWASGPQIWEKQKEYFKEHNIIAPELDSAVLQDVTDKVYALCKNKEQLVIIAWSMGWLAALKLLEYQGLDIKAMISVSGMPKFISEDYIEGGIKYSELRALRMGLKKDFISALNNFYQQHRIPLDAQNCIAKKDLFIRQLDILEKEDLRKNLALIKCPALFIGGENDILCPAQMQNYMASCVKNSIVRIIENSAHAPFLENAEEVNSFIKRFMESMNLAVFSLN